MRGANANNRRRGAAGDSFIQQPTPDHHYRSQFTSRDSDASLASSRPSSIGMGRASTADLYTDRSHQSSAIRAINAYLASHSSNLSLRAHPISSSKDIIDTLNFLLHGIEYSPYTKLDDELFIVLKSLNCPLKVNKSTLRAPNTPHNWPSYLGLIHWLVQIAMYKEQLSENARVFVENNSFFMFSLESYMNYIKGDDDAVEELDRDFVGRLEKERDTVAESFRALEKTCNETEARAEEMRVGPTEREKLEKEKAMLEEDVKKFETMILEVTQRIEMMEKVVEEKGREVGVKLEEKKRIDEENERLRKRVEEQSFNARDAERMKRELQAVERDIGEAEAARNAWEEKMWDLDSSIGHKFKELEGFSMECNQTIRRLKLGSGFQYTLNSKGSTPAEVLGIDYKSIIKPGLESFADDIKKSSMKKLEELISLQQQSSELTARIEGKRNQVDTLQTHIDEVEAQLNLLRKETEDYTSRCAAEAIKTLEDVQAQAHNLGLLESEAAEVLKASKLKLQEAKKQSEDEIQMHARELFACVDSISKYKEQTDSRISEMKTKLSECMAAVSNAYKNSFAARFGICVD